MAPHENADTASKYFRDRSGRHYALHASDQVPTSRAKHRLRLELHQMANHAKASGPVARMDCVLEVVDPQATVCLVELWIASSLRSRKTIDLMLDEWTRRLLPRIGRTTLVGIAVLDLGSAPRAADGQRRFGHFTARPDSGMSPLIHMHSDDDFDSWPEDAQFTEVACPGSDSAAG